MVTVPLLLLVLSGALDLGRAYYFSVSLSDGARNGVRALVGDYVTVGSLTGGPSFNQICDAVKADLSNLPSVSCQQVQHAAPYSPGSDYSAPAPNQAVAVIWCGSASLGCDTVSQTGGSPVHLTGEVDIFYAFSPTTPLLGTMLSGGTINLQSRAQGLTNW